jgi:fermentation-respiration switch protein FrsA (DUF1100 family)
MHWASDREVRDLRAALVYLRSRPDHDQAGFGLFGVSRGGTAALLAAPRERDVWGVITDGAFPTVGMMVAFSVRWTGLYVTSPFLRSIVPNWLYTFLAWLGRRTAERQLNCRFPVVERAVSRLAPRPWLMIHGERDNYVSLEVVQGLFRHAKSPKELWLVPGAKHNRCREADPEAYSARIVRFLDQFGPRRTITAPNELAPSLVAANDELGDTFVGELETSKLTGDVAAPLS